MNSYGGVFIKVKLTGYLKNLTDKKKINIDTYGLKKDNKISYIIDNDKINIEIKQETINMIRENEEIKHVMKYQLNKINQTEYYLKNFKYSIYIDIKTTEMIIKDNYIKITYQVEGSENTYIYLLEMSDK